MNIYLVRHGETNENLKGTYYGDIEAELTERGVVQAENAGRFLKKINFDKIYCSEKTRAKDTLKAMGYSSCITDYRLNERSFGIFEGKTYKDICNEYPEKVKQWNNDWKNYHIEDGESYDEFYKRIESFMEELKNEADKEKNDNILIVSHGGILKSIFVYIMGGNPDLYWKISSGNGDIIIIKYEYENFYIEGIIPSETLEVYNE